MALPAILFEIQFSITYCCHEGCGVPIALPADYERAIGKDGPQRGRSFYCYNGHGQHFTGEPEAVRLQKQLQQANNTIDWVRKQRDKNERTARAFKGVVTRIRNRVKNGVCPCCNRTFQNLMRHMATQHPGYATKEPSEKDET